MVSKLAYKIFVGLIILLILFSHLFIFNKGLIFNPIVICVVSYSAILFFKKLSYDDLIFDSVFAFLFMTVLVFSVILNSYININDGFLFLTFSIYVGFLGILWGVNNPNYNYFIARQRFPSGTIFLSSLFYIIGGIGIAFLGVMIVSVTFTKLNALSFLKVFLEVFSVLTIFYGCYIFAAAITNFCCSILRLNVDENIKNRMYSILPLKNNLIAKPYKIFAYISCFYILFLMIIACFKVGLTALYSLPLTLMAIASIYKLTLRKYDYDQTVGLNNKIFFIFASILGLSTFILYFVTLKIQFVYDIQAFFDNMLLFSNFNNDFYLAYSVLIFMLLGALLSLNNNINSYNFFVKLKNRGYTIYHLFLSVLFLMGCAGYLMGEAINGKSFANVKDYVLISLILAFVSLIVFRFAGYCIVYINQKLTMLKGEQND